MVLVVGGAGCGESTRILAILAMLGVQLGWPPGGGSSCRGGYRKCQTRGLHIYSHVCFE